jgi:hypothetical protein
MLVPEWTTRITNTDVKGEDHLGLEGVAQSYQQYLVPGIISTTNRARYYSFYAWVLYRYINDPDSPRTLAGFRDGYFKRYELAFIAGCYSHHRDRGYVQSLVGSGRNNSKARRIWESRDPIQLGEHLGYFGNKLGGFGEYYRTVMREMGILADPDKPRWVYYLTDRGQRLAQAYEEAIRQTAFFAALPEAGELTQLSREQAKEYGARGCLCSETVKDSPDRSLLLDSFFRLERKDRGDPHVRRRLTLGLILDLVAKSQTAALRETLRPALYLEEYGTQNYYQPASALADTAARWRMVTVRHTYTTAIQALWAVFLERLRSVPEQCLTFEAFMSWVITCLPDGVASMAVTNYLDHLCAAVGLTADWTHSAPDFHEACRQDKEVDECTLYRRILDSEREAETLVPHALRILGQFFLRFYILSQEGNEIWLEVANQNRLPISRFMRGLQERMAESDFTVADWLTWLYQEYCLSQHEAVALGKLRYNRYNTFKFYYQEQTFHWAANPAGYQVPLRYPFLRLENGLTILEDLGLVTEAETGSCHLTTDGEQYLGRTLEVAGGD